MEKIYEGRQFILLNIAVLVFVKYIKAELAHFISPEHTEGPHGAHELSKV